MNLPMSKSSYLGAAKVLGAERASTATKVRIAVALVYFFVRIETSSWLLAPFKFVVRNEDLLIYPHPRRLFKI